MDTVAGWGCAVPVAGRRRGLAAGLIVDRQQRTPRRLLYPKSVSKGLPSLMDPVLEIVDQRIDMGRRNIRIMTEVFGRIESS